MLPYHENKEQGVIQKPNIPFYYVNIDLTQVKNATVVSQTEIEIQSSAPRLTSLSDTGTVDIGLSLLAWTWTLVEQTHQMLALLQVLSNLTDIIECDFVLDIQHFCVARETTRRLDVLGDKTCFIALSHRNI